MGQRKTAKQKPTLWHIAKTYVERFAAHRALVKRALFKWPKRIIQDANTRIHIIDKIKTFFWNTSGSIWLLIASGVFLLYAVWSAFWPKAITSIALHPSASDSIQDPIVTPVETTVITNNETPIVQETTPQEPIIEVQAPAVVDTLQHIYNMYNSINNGNYIAADYFDSYMQTSDLVNMYFTAKRLTSLRAAIDGNINVVSAEEFATDRKDRIGVRYELSYKLLNNSQIFTETRAVTLRPQAWWWRIGTVRCETRWCSVNPFFNVEKYGM